MTPAQYERRMDQWYDLAAAIEAIVRADNGEGETSRAVPPDGLHYPAEYVLLTWQEKRKGILPEMGGLNDQDAGLVYHDWPLVNRLYNEIANRLYPPVERLAGEGNGIPRPDLKHAKDIRSLMEDP